MSAVKKITKKAYEASLESRQVLAALLNRQKLSIMPNDQLIIDDLNKKGVHITNLEQLFGYDANELIKVFQNVVIDLEALNDAGLPVFMERKNASIDMMASVVIAKYPDLFLLCLSQRILKLVESYLGMSTAYHGVVLRRSLVDGLEIGPRLWHKDAEDFHVVRIIVYLNDVVEGGGPFEYIPRSYGLTYNDLKGLKGRFTNENMLKIVPQNAIRSCYGKAGTVIICDSANTFHHEKLQVIQPRNVAMFGFSSRIPRNLDLAMRHFPVESLKSQLDRLLSPGHYPYVYGWRS